MPVRSRPEVPIWPDRLALHGTLTLLALLPFAIDLRLDSPGQGQLHLFRIGAFALLSAHLAFRILKPSGRPPARNLPAGLDVPALAVCGATLFTLVSAARASNPAYALGTALLPLSGAGLFYLLRRAARAGDLFRLSSPVLVVQAALLSAYGIAQHLGLELLPYAATAEKSRVVATLGHPNFLASFLGPAFFVCLARAVRSPRGPARALSAGAAALALVAIALARARGVWLGVAVSAAAVGVLWAVSALRRRGWIGRGLLLAAVAAALAGPPTAASLRRTLVAGSNLESRLTFWRVAASLHEPTALTGVGSGGFAQRFWDEARREAAAPEAAFRGRGLLSLTGENGKPRDPGAVHNDGLEIWAESGGLALYAYLLLLLYLVVFAAVPIVRGENGAAGLAMLLAALLTTLVDASLGFPLSLPCSLAVFWCVVTYLDEEIAKR